MASSICRNSRLFTSKAFFSTTTITSPSPSFRAAKAAIISESDPDKLAELFEQSAHFPTFRRHRPIFEYSIRKLARAQRHDLIDGLIQSQQNDASSAPIKSEGFWIRLLMLYSSAGMIDQAMKTLEDFTQNRHFHFTEKTLCAALSVHLKNGMIDKVHQLFDEMPKRLGVAPGVVSNNLVLKAFVKENKIDSSREWIEKMGKSGIVAPNIDSYNILLGAYLKNGEFSEFDKVVKEVLDKGLEGNSTTYNYRIMRLCKNKECVRARKLLDEMASKGLKPNNSPEKNKGSMPNTASYNTIIDGFCRLGDFDSAKKVLESMLADGYAFPNSFTYYTLIRCMVKEGEFDSALEVCKEIMKRKWVPPFEAMEGLVRGLVKISKAEEAKEIVEKMKTKLRGDAVQSWGKIEATLPI